MRPVVRVDTVNTERGGTLPRHIRHQESFMLATAAKALRRIRRLRLVANYLQYCKLWIVSQCRVIPPAKNYLEPIALEIGKLVIEWNSLQENLLLIFCEIVTHKVGGPATAVWHSTTNDRAQREMLRAAIETNFIQSQVQKTYPHKISQELKDEYDWLLSQANTLANQRNNAIHSPFIISIPANGAKPKSPLITCSETRLRPEEAAVMVAAGRWDGDRLVKRSPPFQRRCYDGS
jgi:hypothetical protein